MMHAVLSLSLALVGAPVTPSIAPLVVSAATAQTTQPTKASLDQLYSDAQMHVERYNATGDAAQLRTAKAMLEDWLRGHAQLYGYGDDAVKARGPVQKQVAAIDTQIGASPAPAPAATAPAPAPAPPPTPVSPELAARQKRADSMINGGLVLGALGLSSVLFIGLPAWGLRDNALDNAKQERFYVDEQDYLERARLRHKVMIGSLAAGGVLLIGGIALLTVGAVGKASVKRELAIAPAVGPRMTGLTARFRF